MRVRRLWCLVVVLVAVGVVPVLAARPLSMAHGEFRAGLFLGPWAFQIQSCFNVQDRGDAAQDHGTFSMRVFDWHSGDLLTVVRAVDVWDVRPDGEAIAFEADLIVVAGEFPFPTGHVTIVAFDDGADDRVLIGSSLGWIMLGDFLQGGIKIRSF
ncbi:hypothetical protein JW848_09065 [Candidatus Bipolaricaulota bacterium]|nr:hypothetical protein [Candidatus Bipolaricaulota bacterium]